MQHTSILQRGEFFSLLLLSLLYCRTSYMQYCKCISLLVFLFYLHFACVLLELVLGKMSVLLHLSNDAHCDIWICLVSGSSSPQRCNFFLWFFFSFFFFLNILQLVFCLCILRVFFLLFSRYFVFFPLTLCIFKRSWAL